MDGDVRCRRRRVMNEREVVESAQLKEARTRGGGDTSGHRRGIGLFDKDSGGAVGRAAEDSSPPWCRIGSRVHVSDRHAGEDLGRSRDGIVFVSLDLPRR